MKQRLDRRGRRRRRGHSPRGVRAAPPEVAARQVRRSAPQLRSLLQQPRSLPAAAGPAPAPAGQQLTDLTFAVSDNFEIEGYVAGFGNLDWKSTHAAASRTAVAVTTLLKQGATCVGRTIMDELGFGWHIK